MDGKQLFIVHWDSGQVLGQAGNLAEAKRAARSLGHTGASNGKYFAPVAFVGEPDGQGDFFCTYNPTFTAPTDDHQVNPFYQAEDVRPHTRAARDLAPKLVLWLALCQAERFITLAVGHGLIDEDHIGIEQTNATLVIVRHAQALVSEGQV